MIIIVCIVFAFVMIASMAYAYSCDRRLRRLRSKYAGLASAYKELTERCEFLNQEVDSRKFVIDQLNERLIELQNESKP